MSARLPDDDEEEPDLFGPGPGSPMMSRQANPAVGGMPSSFTGEMTSGNVGQMMNLMVQMLQQNQVMMTQTQELMKQMMESQKKDRGESLASPPGIPPKENPSYFSAGTEAPKSSSTNRAERYLPPIPKLTNEDMGKTRMREVESWHAFLENFSTWLALIDEQFITEVKAALVYKEEIVQKNLAMPIATRSARLYYYLTQSLSAYNRGMEILRSTSTRQDQAACGYECMRQLHDTFSIVSRMEAISVRDAGLQLNKKAEQYQRPLDVVRFLQDEFGKNDVKLSRFEDLKMNIADKVNVLLQSVTEDARRYVVLHGDASTWEGVVRGLRFYEEQTRMVDLNYGYNNNPRVNAMKGKNKKGKGKGKNKDKGHSSWNEQEGGQQKEGKGKGVGDGYKKYGQRQQPQRSWSQGSQRDITCHNCGKKGHKAAQCWSHGGGKGKKGKNRNWRLDTEGAPSEALSQPEGEQDAGVMLLKTGTLCTEHVQRSSVGTKQQVGPTDFTPAGMWLIDSGATSHIVALRFLSQYEVVRKHDNEVPVLRDASDEVVKTFGVVDIKARFGTHEFTIQKCLVADLTFNVLSPYVLGSLGWKVQFGRPTHCHENFIKKRNRKLKMVMHDRSWWLKATLKELPAQPMEVDSLRIFSVSSRSPVLEKQFCENDLILRMDDAGEVKRTCGREAGQVKGDATEQTFTEQAPRGKPGEGRSCLKKAGQVRIVQEMCGGNPYSYVCRRRGEKC